MREKEKPYSRALRYTATAAVALLTVSALYNGLTVKRYTLTTSKLGKGKRLAIALVADLHSTIHGTGQKHLLQKIEKEAPDVILLAGDIADDFIPMKGTRLFLEGIQGLAPAYYVPGNHEYKAGCYEGIRQEFELYGVTVLSDEYVLFPVGNEQVLIAGADDPFRWREYPGYKQADAMEAAFSGLDAKDGMYKILMAHRPERIDTYKRYPFDLVVNGHAHGGQVRIPYLINGLYTPNQGFFPKYAGGVYRHQNMVQIVSRGLSVTPLLPRIYNPPELVMITVEGK